MGPGEGQNPSFHPQQYLFRRKLLKLFGGAFHVFDEQGNLLLYSELKAFRLRADFRVYADERKIEELLKITTPQILDFSSTYNVQDGITGENVGAIKRKGIKSIFKDEWVFLSNSGQEVGIMTEISILAALLSRFINIIPQTYVISAGNRKVAEIKQHFNPFILKYSMTILEPKPLIDKRLLVAAGILLVGIEQRQQ
ncbi:hypothetical protein ACFL4C_00595 [Candidatus Omnitrophota bacterium]